MWMGFLTFNIIIYSKAVPKSCNPQKRKIGQGSFKSELFARFYESKTYSNK